ncbi:MAG: hypothetical protein JSU74_03325 [Candidatus Zixiibacteriota bacterium]|nr:MAG: hypothetical protein JSU74_03325 [candidate division Zixibacteria bacterium]
MKHRFHRWSINRWAIMASLITAGGFILGLILAGCSDNGLVFEVTDSEERVSFFDQPYYDDALAKRTDILEAEVTFHQARLRTSEGGVLTLGEDENIEAFVVLPNSFVDDTTFTVEVTKIVTEDGEALIVFEFGPDGLQFFRPAVLRLDLGVLFGRNVTSVEFAWLDEETHMWGDPVTYDADSNQIACVSIGHFSTGMSKGAEKDPSTDSGSGTSK